MKNQPELTVTEERTEDLIPYANNAKIHTNEQVEQIVKSIEEFGFNDPIAIWHNANNEMEIVEGHGRVLAASKMGLEVVPTICLDHLTDEQRRAYTHVHNQLTMNTGWNFETLDLDLADLDFDFGDFGFDVADTTEQAENPYSEAVNGLIYEPSADMPLIDSLLDSSEAELLVEKVKCANGITRAERCFLEQACGRFNRFDYEKIADYYAHADTECQELMRELKLVIVDDGAMEQAAGAFIKETDGAWEVA